MDPQPASPSSPTRRGWLPQDQLRLPASTGLLQHAYNHGVITDGIREFVSRDWAAARENKDAYWGERIARLGPLEAFRVAEELRRQALARDPEWPALQEREADLECHARVAALLRRADPARRG